MDTIYDTLAKLNKVANAPEIVKEDNNALMKKGLEDLMRKTSKMNKQSDYKPFGKDDKDYETGLPKDAKKDKMFDDMAAADASKMNKQSTYTPFSDKQSPDGLPEKKKDNKMFEKESDVERDDRAEKAGREVKRDAKYDGRDHAGKDGKSVTKDIEYDEKHDKDGMHEAQGYDDKEDESLGMRTGKESDKKQSMKDRRDDSYGKFGKRDKEHADGKMHVGEDQGYDDKEDESLGMRTGKEADKKQSMKDRRDDSYGKFGKRDKEHEDGKMHMGENSGTLKDAARQGVMARLAELAGIPAQEIEEALGTPQDIADKIMHENPIDEAEVEEGNEFSGERDKAIKAGKNDFTVDGKTYPVKGDKNESLEESDIDQIAEVGKVYPKIAKLKMKLVDDGMEPEDAHDEACEKYDVDPAMCDKYIEMQRDDRETKKVSEGGGRDMDCATCDGTGKDDDKECKSCEGSGEAQDDDDPMNNESKVEETTSSGSVATGDGAGKPLYNAPSIYETNEIVKRARQLNEDMSFTVSGGPDQEPTLNINASGAEAQQLGQLLKLSGLGMQPAAPQYGAMEIEVSEDQEFANSNQNEETADTNTLVNTISGGLNGQKKMAYPRASQGDNAMATLGESELVETSANQLMKQYQAFKTK